MKNLPFIIITFILLIMSGCKKAPSGEASRKADLIFLTEEYAPLNFSSKDKIQGMTVDVVKAICRILKIKPEIKIKSWGETYEKALKTPNVVVFSIDRTQSREDKFYWIEPSVAKLKVYFYERKDSEIEINRLKEAKRYKIGTTKDFFSEEFLKNKGFKNLRSFANQEKTLNALINGEVDLAVFSSLRLEHLVDKAGLSVSDLLPVYKIKNGHFYIAISRGTSKKVVEEWQKAFDLIRQNRTYYKIYKKWFLSHKIY